MTDIVQQVYDMQSKFGIDKNARAMDPDVFKKYLRFRSIMFLEETTEYVAALEENNAEEINDAIIDLLIFVIGTANATFASKKDFLSAFDKVMSSNNKKSIGIKKERNNPLGLIDLIKDSDWKSPDIKKESEFLNNRIK